MIELLLAQTPVSLALYLCAILGGIMVTHLLFNFCIRRIFREVIAKKALQLIGMPCKLLFLLLLTDYLLDKTDILHEYHDIEGVFTILIALLVWLVSYRCIDLAVYILQHGRWKFGNKGQYLFLSFSKLLKGLWIVLGVVASPMLFIADKKGFFATFSLSATGLLAILGLSFQNMIKNIISTITIIVNQTFLVHDWVKIGKLSGRIVAIGIVSTKLKTDSGAVVYLANNILLKEKIHNYGPYSYATMSIQLPTSSLTTLEKMVQTCRDLIHQTKDVIADKCLVTTPAEDDLNTSRILLHLYFMPNDPLVRRSIRIALYDKIKEQAQKEQIAISLAA